LLAKQRFKMTLDCESCPKSTRDTKKKSLIETGLDVGIGFIMYLPINFLILPLFGEQISSYDLLGFFQLSAIFTVIALVRKYTIRRWFSKTDLFCMSR
tara:strand:- start:1789 stop:2082 length:294 start_codon:yes stop_codon:yes gene_type:complete